MKRIIKMCLSLGFVFAVLLGAADSSCGGVKSSPKTPAPVVKLTGVTLQGVAENGGEVHVGHKLVALLVPANATNPTYQWMTAPMAVSPADSDYSAIPGATFSSYTPKLAQSPNHIKVIVTAGGVTMSSTAYNIGLAMQNVFLSTDSLGTAGNAKITGLTAGKKYKITTVDGRKPGEQNPSGTVKYSVANGIYRDFVDAQGNAIALTGTEITHLENDMTYKVEAVN